MAVYEIEVFNWTKYNPRNDTKKHFWFRFDIDMIDEDEVIAKLNPSQFKVWCALLCVKCRVHTNVVRVDTELLHRKSRVRTQVIHDTIALLTDMGRISSNLVQGSTNDTLEPKALKPKHDRIRALRNDTIRNDTIRNDTPQPEVVAERDPLDPEDLSLAKDWLEHAEKTMNWSKPPKSWTVDSFAKAIEKVRAKKNITSLGMREIFKFICDDSFWVKNALSPASLLNKNKNDVYKIDNILVKLKPFETKEQRAIREFIDRPDDNRETPF